MKKKTTVERGGAEVRRKSKRTGKYLLRSLRCIYYKPTLENQ